VIVRFAMTRPDAKKQQMEKWNERFSRKSGAQTIGKPARSDPLTNLFRSFDYLDGLHYLPRRKTAGNMVFKDDEDACMSTSPKA